MAARARRARRRTREGGVRPGPPLTIIPPHAAPLVPRVAGPRGEIVSGAWRGEIVSGAARLVAASARVREPTWSTGVSPPRVC